MKGKSHWGRIEVICVDIHNIWMPLICRMEKLHCRFTHQNRLSVWTIKVDVHCGDAM